MSGEESEGNAFVACGEKKVSVPDSETVTLASASKVHIGVTLVGYLMLLSL